MHGMGTTQPGFANGLRTVLQARLGPLFADLHFNEVYYQSVLQANEERVWSKVSDKVNWAELRKFILYGFGDATGLEAKGRGQNPESSAYWQTQLIIAQALLRAHAALGDDAPLVMLAHSLGGQVLSNYFWDATQPAAREGVWADIERAGTLLCPGRKLSPGELRFLRGGSLRLLITTGCNIPIFVAANACDQILPIRPNEAFRWDNYYDKDDVLGWPLADLSPEYGAVVHDHAINASGEGLGWLTHGWNPLAHTKYWEDASVLDPLETVLRAVLGAPHRNTRLG